jgi:proline iminopeptidase
MTDHPPSIVETPTSKIYFEKTGAPGGVPLILVNGGPGFDHTYLKVSSVWETLAQDRPVVFYDQRGTGQSSEVGEDETCTIPDQLADLEALRDHLAAEKVHLLGHSFGGFLSMAYTARYPHRVDHLIVADSAAPKLEDTKFLFEDIFPETIERQQAVAFAVEFDDDQDAIGVDLNEYFSMLCYSPEKRDELLSKADPGSYRHQVNKKVWADAQRFDLNPELRKFTQPTLVIHGRYDINVALSVSYAIHQAIPGSRFEALERSGHLPFFEEPEAFAGLVKEFLAGD